MSAENCRGLLFEHICIWMRSMNADCWMRLCCKFSSSVRLILQLNSWLFGFCFDSRRYVLGCLLFLKIFPLCIGNELLWYNALALCTLLHLHAYMYHNQNSERKPWEACKRATTNFNFRDFFTTCHSRFETRQSSTYLNKSGFKNQLEYFILRK